MSLILYSTSHPNNVNIIIIIIINNNNNDSNSNNGNHTHNNQSIVAEQDFLAEHTMVSPAICTQPDNNPEQTTVLIAILFVIVTMMIRGGHCIPARDRTCQWMKV